MMVEVDGDKVVRAFMTFRRACNLNGEEAFKLFMQSIYIADNTSRSGPYPYYLLTEDEAHRVEQMIGEHGHAYCKALIARNTGLRCD